MVSGAGLLSYSMAKTYALPDESLHTIYALCAFESATTVLGLMIGPYPMLLGIGHLLAPLTASEDLGLTVPAKITSYLAGGRPIVTCMDGEGSEEVIRAGAGLTAASGDAEKLAENILRIYEMSPRERKNMGERAREYHLEFHQREKVLSRLIDFILK